MERRALYVQIPFDLLPKLREIGEQEFRSAKEQASVLLIEATERRLAELRQKKAQGKSER
ncbi:MAG TPA: hypothetical protein VM305_01215 [Candidatus Limnocylindrales bacterium]|nr:hypothetical protein [Candidatus Limnocylindrales bacterium]